MLGRITAFESVTLDGVMQAPGRADEDTRGGFTRGGWAGRYSDQVAAEESSKAIAAAADGALLFGRRTYEDFYRVWANNPEPNPFTDVLNRMQKYVASRTLEEPLPWANSTLLSGDAKRPVAELKERGEENLVILGSGALVRSLVRAGLVDEFVLSIHPLVLGSGRTLFEQPGPSLEFRLVGSIPTTTGVIIATYEATR